MAEKIIGILGGMGPEATIALFARIVKLTGAKKDQDHLRVLIDNNPKVPDRTKAIRGNGPSPLPQLIRSGKTLEKAGADFIIIPCVTAHYYVERLQKKINIPILHIAEETVKHMEARLKGVRRVGLIATTGTVQAGIFQRFFSKIGKELILPTADIQEKKVMKAIYGKKGIKAIGPADHSRRLILQASQALVGRGAQAVIAGCTEVPLVLQEDDLPVPIIDPLTILAQSAIAMARGKRR